MSIRSLRTLILRFAILTLSALTASAACYILQVAPGVNAAQVASKYGLTLGRQIDDDDHSVYLVTYPDPAPATLISQVAADPSVRGFESDDKVVSTDVAAPVSGAINLAALAPAIQNTSIVNYYGAPVRASYAQQPATALIELASALTNAVGAGVTVAVIDTGVDPNHPALKNVLVPGYDFTRNQAGYASEFADLAQSTVAILDQSTVAILDTGSFPVVLNQSTVAILDQSTVAILDGTQLPSDFGHGTMVSGLIHLVAPQASIMPLKAFNVDGSANLSDIVSAIYYAADHNANVINMSFSSLTQSPSITAAVQYAWKKGVTCIASAGNEGQNVVVYPAGDYGVIGVGSTSNADLRSFFSNYGVKSIKLSAPGEALITAYPGNNYAGVWGTSFSAALTSGAAALLTQVKPKADGYLVKQALEHGHKLNVGMGQARLDILASILYILTANPDD